MDPDTVRQLADELEQLWHDLTDGTPGTLEDLLEKSNAVSTGDAFGRWETAREMADSYATAYRKMEMCYQQLRDQLALAVTALRFEADDIENVDNVVAESLPEAPAAIEPGIAATPGMQG